MRQLVIGLPAVVVEARAQLGLPIGGDTLANDTIILGERIGMDADFLAARAAVASSHNSAAINSRCSTALAHPPPVT